MKVSDLVERFGLKVYSGEEGLNNEINGGYVSDLLSDVMGNAAEGEGDAPRQFAVPSVAAPVHQASQAAERQTDEDQQAAQVHGVARVGVRPRGDQPGRFFEMPGGP